MTRPHAHPPTSKHKRLSGFFRRHHQGGGATSSCLARASPRKSDAQPSGDAQRTPPSSSLSNKGGRAGLRRLHKTYTPGGAHRGEIASALSVPAMKRLARRAGVKRISKPAFGDIRESLLDFLRPVLGDLVIITEHARRRTVTTMDVLLALKRRGRVMYGYGDYLPEQIKQVQRRVARLREPLSKTRRSSAAIAVEFEPEVTAGEDVMDDARQLQVQIAVADVMQHMTDCSVPRLLTAVNLRLETSSLRAVDALQFGSLLQKLHDDERLMLDGSMVYLL